MANKDITTESQILDKLGPVADALKVGVAGTWKIFTGRYLAKGAAELLAAIAIVVASTIKMGTTTNSILLPWAVALFIFTAVLGSLMAGFIGD